MSVPSAPGCQAAVMQPSVGTLNNVTTRENCINFPARGNRRDTSLSLSSLLLPVCMNQTVMSAKGLESFSSYLSGTCTLLIQLVGS